MKTFETTDEAYQATLTELLDRPEYRVSPRGLTCFEIMNWAFRVTSPSSGSLSTADSGRDVKMKRYLEIEKELYLEGELRARVWAERASKFWAGLANEDGTINSNYGWLIFRNPSLSGLTPWEWVRRSLTLDRESRQAYVRVAMPEHQRFGVKDQVCTLHLMFMIRAGRLHLTAVMRSNDVVRGLAYDMPWFCYLLEKLAGELGETVGTYIHLAHSMHLYDADRQTAERMVGR